MTATIRISYLPGGERDRDPRGADVTWDQLCLALGRGGVEPSPCDLATCGVGEHAQLNSSGKVVGCRHKYGAAWMPAVFPPGATRSKKNVGVVSLLVLDLDHMSELDLALALAELEPYQYVAHGSHGDRKAGERAVRAVVRLSEPVLAEDWPRFWETAVNMLGGDADPATCDASRLYFLPTRRSDCEFYYEEHAGAPLDVRAVLAAAPPVAPLPDLAGPSGEFGPASAALVAEARDRLRRSGPAVEGEGGDRHTYNMCCAVLHDLALSDEEAWPLLVEWNETCRPPWALDELRVKMENARSYAEGPRGAGRREVEGGDAIAEAFGVLGGEAPEVAPDLSQYDEPGPIEVPEEGDVLALLGSISRAHPQLAEPAGEPGTWPHEIVRARRDVARALAAGVGDSANAADLQLFQSATTLLGQDLPPTSWLVRGVLTEGGVAAIVGPPKTTKSWLAIEVALCVASGLDVMGRFQVPRPRASGYFFAEDHAESVVTRIRAFAAGRGMRPEDLARNFHVQPRGKYLDLTRDDDVARVVASARMIGELGLLVLDPLRDIHSGKENESDDMAAVFKRLRVIAVLLNCAVLVVHHGKKVGKDGVATNGDEIRGSSVINAALDARIIMRGMTTEHVDACLTSTFTSDVEAVVKRGRSAGEFQAKLVVVDGPDDAAVSARWSHSSRSEAASAAETTANPERVADSAAAMMDHLQRVELMKEPAPPIKAIQKAIGGNQDRVYAAIAYAEAKMWVRRNERRRVELTDAGRAHLRGPEKPAEPAPATLDQIIAE